MVSIAIAVTHAAVALLVVSGVAKVVRPLSVVGALRALGLPDGRGVATALGAFEVALGVIVLTGGGAAFAAAVAILYAAFALAVVQLRRRDAAAPCGCFGHTTPPTQRHLVANALMAGTAAVAGRDMPSLLSVLGHQPLAGVPYLLLLVTAAYCLYATLSVGPTLRAAAR